jgi:hypothetical protein
MTAADEAFVDHRQRKENLMRIIPALITAFVAGSALAALPPPTEDAKAKAAADAAVSAWSDKIAQYQLCIAIDRTAERYRNNLKAARKDAPPSVATAPCVDPGPYVAPPTLAARPLEAAGAHSPAETTATAPSTNATASELAGGLKK